MGADIYLESKFRKNHDLYKEKFEKAVTARDMETNPLERNRLQILVSEYFDKMYSEGYFRDSYNPSSFMAVIDLSWWVDVVPMLNKKGYLPIKNTRKLLKMIEDRPMTDDRIEAHMKKHNIHTEKVEWKKFFKKQHEEFRALLQESIDLKEPLRMSL